jgi:hypothetical protein
MDKETKGQTENKQQDGRFEHNQLEASVWQCG